MGYAIAPPALDVRDILAKRRKVGHSRLAQPQFKRDGHHARADQRMQGGDRRRQKRADKRQRMRQCDQGADSGQAAGGQRPVQHELPAEFRPADEAHQEPAQDQDHDQPGDAFSDHASRGCPGQGFQECIGLRRRCGLQVADDAVEMPGAYNRQDALIGVQLRLFAQLQCHIGVTFPDKRAVERFSLIGKIGECVVQQVARLEPFDVFLCHLFPSQQAGHQSGNQAGSLPPAHGAGQPTQGDAHLAVDEQNR